MKTGADTADTISASQMCLSPVRFSLSSFLLLLGDKTSQKLVISGQYSSLTPSNKKDKRLPNHRTSKSAFKKIYFFAWMP